MRYISKAFFLLSAYCLLLTAFCFTVAGQGVKQLSYDKLSFVAIAGPENKMNIFYRKDGRLKIFEQSEFDEIQEELLKKKDFYITRAIVPIGPDGKLTQKFSEINSSGAVSDGFEYEAALRFKIGLLKPAMFDLEHNYKAATKSGMKSQSAKAQVSLVEGAMTPIAYLPEVMMSVREKRDPGAKGKGDPILAAVVVYVGPAGK